MYLSQYLIECTFFVNEKYLVYLEKGISDFKDFYKVLEISEKQ